MTQDLITTFGRSDGGTYNWKYKGLGPELSAPEIKEACELLTKLDICTKNGVKLFDSVITAKVVITKETTMFDPETETKGLTYYGEPAKEASCEEVGCFNVADEQEEKSVVLTEPKQTVLPITRYGRYFKRLTSIEPAEKVEVTVEKDTLQQSKTVLIEKIEQNHDSLPLNEPDSSQNANERNGLLQWLHRIRKKNKEGPAEIPRE